MKKHIKVKAHGSASNNKDGKLIQSIKCGRKLDIIKKLLIHGESVNWANRKGDTALHVAVRYGRNFGTIAELIAHGANIDAQNDIGDTPLIVATKSGGKLGIVKSLLNHGADVNLCNKSGNTALNLAVTFYGKVEIIKELLKFNADVNIGNERGDNPLIRALKYSRNDELIELLLANKADINKSNDAGDTPLILLTERDRRFEVIKKFLELGANVNVCNNAYDSPLNLAVKFDRKLEVIKEFFKFGANVNVTDEVGNTPLNLAILHSRDLAIIKELLQQGPALNAKNDNCDTPLILAIKLNKGAELIKELLSHGANPNLISCYMTPLKFAIPDRNAEVIKELLMHGADPNLVTPARVTPMYEALYKLADDIELLEQFINHGAQIKLCGDRLYGELLFDMYTHPVCKFVIKHGLIEDSEHFISRIGFDYCGIKVEPETLFSDLEKCLEEITKMKAIRVSKVSLYELLAVKNINVALFSSNEFVRNIMEKRLELDYPMYNDMITQKIIHAVERGTLLKQLRDVNVYTNSLASDTPSEDKIVHLNPESTAVIAKYLSNSDVHDFIMAFSTSCHKVGESSSSSVGNLKYERDPQTCRNLVGNCSIKRPRLA